MGACYRIIPENIFDSYIRRKWGGGELLIHCILNKLSYPIYWTSPFVIIEVSAGVILGYLFSKEASCFANDRDLDQTFCGI